LVATGGRFSQFHPFEGDAMKLILRLAAAGMVVAGLFVAAPAAQAAAPKPNPHPCVSANVKIPGMKGGSYCYDSSLSKVKRGSAVEFRWRSRAVINNPQSKTRTYYYQFKLVRNGHGRVGPTKRIDVKHGQTAFDPAGESIGYPKFEHRCPSGQKIDASVRVSLQRAQGGKGWGSWTRPHKVTCP
jgi:hypothetical protein